MFTEVDHELVGAVAGWMPRGFSPWNVRRETYDAILWNGDYVTVLSAWDRDYLDDAPILLYVQSHTTRLCTHVPAYELFPVA